MARNIVDELHVPDDGKWPSILALIAGLSYGGIGVLQLLVSLQIVAPITGFNDLMGGILLIIIASIFLTGVKPLSKDEKEGYAFIAVAYMLAAILFALQLMVIITNALGWILQFEDWIAWNIYTDITPSLWIFLILMTATGALWVFGSLREKLVIQAKEVAAG